MLGQTEISGGANEDVANCREEQSNHVNESAGDDIEHSGPKHAAHEVGARESQEGIRDLLFLKAVVELHMLRENRGGILDAVESEHAVDKGKHGSPSRHDLPVLQIIGSHFGVEPGVVAKLTLSKQALNVLIYCLLGLVAFDMDTTLFLIGLKHHRTYRVTGHCHADGIVFISHTRDSRVVSAAAVKLRGYAGLIDLGIRAMEV